MMPSPDHHQQARELLRRAGVRLDSNPLYYESFIDELAAELSRAYEQGRKDRDHGRIVLDPPWED